MTAAERAHNCSALIRRIALAPREHKAALRARLKRERTAQIDAEMAEQQRAVQRELPLERRRAA